METTTKIEVLRTRDNITSHFSEEDQHALRQFYAFLQLYHEEVSEISQVEMAKHPILGPIIASIPPAVMELSKRRSDELMTNAILHNDWEPLLKDLNAQSLQMAKLGLNFQSLYGAIKKSLQTLENKLVQHFENDLEKALPAIRGIRIYLDVILENFTESQLESQRHINEMQQESQTNLKNAQNEFIYVASHNLQEPVTNIISILRELDGLLTKDQLDAETQELFAHLETAADIMNVLILDLLNYARIGSMSIQSKVDLNLLVKSAVIKLSNSGETLASKIKIGPLPSMITVFPTEMELVFFHLLQNAIHFRAKERDFECQVSCFKEDQKWIISISDNGVGISETEVHKIFQLFKTNPNNGNAGTGVGLAICKNVVHLHGGKIWVESGIQPKTTTFNICLPAA